MVASSSFLLPRSKQNLSSPWRRRQTNSTRGIILFLTSFPLGILLCAFVVCSWMAVTAKADQHFGPYLDCDPCIDRSEYTIKAILHGTSDQDFWQQVVAAMRQAALDMGVKLEVELPRSTSSFDSFQMAQEIATAARNKDQYDALIVTIPDTLVQEAVAIAIDVTNMPIFGMNLGYQVGRQIGMLGFAAQDEFVAGTAAAEEFMRITNVTKAMFVQNGVDAGLEDRYRGFREALRAPAVAVVDPTTFEDEESFTNETTIAPSATPIIRQVDRIVVDPDDQFNHVTALQAIFENDCEYDVVMLGSAASLDVALSALESSGCVGRTVLASFDKTPKLIAGIVNGRVAFGVDEQPYLQAVLPVYFAAIYVTTGKALALPVEERVYLSGPTIVTAANAPTDTLQECTADAFPVCPNQLAPNGDEAGCQCTDRSKIRIGGVLHGVTTDIFWDPVFASAEQAAVDMGVDLDLIRFGPGKDEDIFVRMAARIKALCEGGVDGIFVSIPSDTVVESIMRCQELQVPVISVNAGAAKAEELGLLNHIGMLEYSAGYGAAARLIEAGMQRGYCLDHAPGNIVTAQRCQGFGDAIGTFGQNVEYMGVFDVPLDNKVQYGRIVTEAVGDDGDWSGIGILLLGPSQIEPYEETLAEKHPAAIVGSFDLSSDLYTGIESGRFRFGIDQQPFLQGNMPVILLALEAYTKQHIKNHVVETGPHFVDAAPSRAEVICEVNSFQICPNRPPEDMNYISDGFLAFGYALFGLLLVCAGLAGGWTFYYREKWVVKISQPFYMYLMLCGVVLSSLSIFFLGFQTEYPYQQDKTSGQLTNEENPDIGMVDAACMLVPWFYGLGFAVTFSAIFAKIQRVKLIYLAGMSMQRKKVTFKDVANIMIVMLGIEFALLLSWQLVSPFRWERTVTGTEDGFPVESVGKCASDSGSYFFLAIILFNVFCLIFALVLSWQTKDINSEFAESSYLFLTVMFMFQVQCLAVPILALVQDSPEVFYFVQAIAIFCQNITVVVLIFGPKMYRVFIGQADLAGGGTAAAGRGANHQRMSLSRQAPNYNTATRGRGRTSFASVTGRADSSPYARSSSFDLADANVGASTQFVRPLSTISGEDDSSPSILQQRQESEQGSSSSAIGALSSSAAASTTTTSEQHRRSSPINKRGVSNVSSQGKSSEVSFQDAMEVWLENSNRRSRSKINDSTHTAGSSSGGRGGGGRSGNASSASSILMSESIREELEREVEEAEAQEKKEEEAAAAVAAAATTQLPTPPTSTTISEDEVASPILDERTNE